MIRIAKTIFMFAVFCLFVVCADLQAQVQDSAAAAGETSLGLGAIDASVHAEVDGQPHDPIPVASSNQHAALRSTARPPVTVFWPTHADILTTDKDDIDGSSNVGVSSFGSATKSGQLSLHQPGNSDTTVGAKSHEVSTQGNSPVLGISPFRPLTLDTESSSNWKSHVQQVPEPDESAAANSPFGRAALGAGEITSHFQRWKSSKYKNQTAATRHERREHKPATIAASKDSFDSLANTRH
jgi:hypothetical protein